MEDHRSLNLGDQLYRPCRLVGLLLANLGFVLAVTFSEPYMMLFTYRSEMNEALGKLDLPEQTKNHLRLLLQFLREEMPRTSAKLDEIKAGTCTKISFQDLWLLYLPNTPVYTSSNGEDRQMVV